MREFSPSPRGDVRRRWEAAATAAEVGRLRKAVTAFVARLGGIPAGRLPDLELVVSELVTNVARHAYGAGRPGAVVVDVTVDGHVELVVADTGDGLAPEAVVDRRHGLGIVHALADQVDVRSSRGRGTTVTVVFGER